MLVDMHAHVIPGALDAVGSSEDHRGPRIGPCHDDEHARLLENDRGMQFKAIEDGKKIPKARPIEKLRRDPEVAAALRDGAVLASVPLIVDAGRTVRINLSLDAGTVAAIDEAANARGLTRSAFLASAAREKIVNDA